jgi:hypothetical protein
LVKVATAMFVSYSPLSWNVFVTLPTSDRSNVLHR